MLVSTCMMCLLFLNSFAYVYFGPNPYPPGVDTYILYLTVSRMICKFYHSGTSTTGCYTLKPSLSFSGRSTKRCHMRLLCEGDTSPRYPAIMCSANECSGSSGTATF